MRRVIKHLVTLARQAGCYKVLLVCEDSVVPFYEKCEFERMGAYMVRCCQNLHCPTESTAALWLRHELVQANYIH